MAHTRGVYVAAYNIVSAGGFEFSLSQSSLAPLMEECDRAVGAMRLSRVRFLEEWTRILEEI